MTDDKYLDLYASFLEKFADLKRPIKAVFDCSNGVTSVVLKKLKIKNLEPKVINNKLDGHFPAHGPNPLLPGALNELSQAVKLFGADIGVAFDADGDRAFFIDRKGEEMPPYFMAALLAQSQKPPFVFDIFNFEALKYSGFKAINQAFPSPVGTYFIKSEMARRRASLAVEYSGHYYFKDFFSADSGIFAAIKILNIISQKAFFGPERPLPNQISVSQFNSPTKNTKEFFRKLKEKYSKRASKISELDGLTFEFKEGWLTARSSNTEPLIRFFIGGEKNFVFTNKKTVLNTL